MARNDSRIGIVAFLGATALVLVALVAFARYPSLFRSGHPYRAVFRQVPGLNLGDEVRYGGLLVGSITSLEIDPRDPTRIVVSFRVKRGTPIRADTHAAITQVGFLGQPYLNLSPGRRDALVLPPGSTLLSDDNLTFQDAMSRLAVFLQRADTLFGGVEQIAQSSPLERFNRTLYRVDTLVGAANASTQRVFAQLDSATRQISELMTRSERLIATLDTTVRSARPDLASTQREALATLRETRSLVGEMREALERGERVETIARNLETATENLSRLSERLERDPTSVLRRAGTINKPAGPRPRD